MQLNSYKTSGWKGFMGWRNLLPYRKKIVHSTSQKVSKKSISIINFELPIPKISVEQFMFVVTIIFLVGIFFISFSVFFWIREDIEYRNVVRHQVQYSIEQTILPYKAKIEDVNLRLQGVESYVNSFTVDPYRKREKKKYRIGNSNKFEWR